LENSKLSEPKAHLRQSLDDMSQKMARKEAAAIKQEMQAIRNELPYAMDDARRELKQFSDWKFYVGKFPLTSVAMTALVAYKLVPKSEPPRPQISVSQRELDQAEGKTFLSSLLGAATAMVVRTGSSLAMQQAGKLLQKATSGHHQSNDVQEAPMTHRPVPK